MKRLRTYLLTWGFITAVALLPSEWTGQKIPSFLQKVAPRLEAGVKVLDDLVDKGFVLIARLVTFSPSRRAFSVGGEEGGIAITHAHMAWIVSLLIALGVYFFWRKTKTSPNLVDDLLILPVSYLGWQIIARVLWVTGVPGGKYLASIYAFPMFFGLLTLSLLGLASWKNARVILIGFLVFLIFLSGPIVMGINLGLVAIAFLRNTNATLFFVCLGLTGLGLVATSTFGAANRQRR